MDDDSPAAEGRAKPEGSSLGDDLLLGATPIGNFMFGEDDPKKAERRVYHLASEVPPEDRPPIFRIGNLLAARKSRLLAWVEEREAETLQPPRDHPEDKGLPKNGLTSSRSSRRKNRA